MKEIKKPEDVTCDYEGCKREAVTKVETEVGDAELKLCRKHEQEYAEKLRNKIKEKYGDLSKEEIAKKMVREGEGIL